MMKLWLWIVVGVCLSEGLYAWDAKDLNNRTLPLDQVVIAQRQTGMTIQQYRDVNSQANFKPIKKNGTFSHYEYKHTKEGKESTDMTIFIADINKVIFHIYYRKVFPESVLRDDVFKSLFDQYGYHLSDTYEGSFTDIRCYHGCVENNAEMRMKAHAKGRIVDHSISFYPDQTRFMVYVTGHSERDKLMMPANGVIVFEMVDGKRKKESLALWKSKLQPKRPNFNLDIN